ncbi:unnamed protein product (mitochondrion) [Arabidopsis thaliana]|uniref:(thale cress) hypothetical protein n=1 Tax=Arabidopsis thaliana TaxID=3702 RepID=A0A7G2FLC6_ARATH|nr:unnamed protein product [Arabidopsis thaliana]
MPTLLLPGELPPSNIFELANPMIELASNPFQSHLTQQKLWIHTWKQAMPPHLPCERRTRPRDPVAPGAGSRVEIIPLRHNHFYSKHASAQRPLLTNGYGTRASLFFFARIGLSLMTFLLSLPCPTKVKVNQLQGGIDLFLLFICAGNPFIICPELHSISRKANPRQRKGAGSLRAIPGLDIPGSLLSESPLAFKRSFNLPPNARKPIDALGFRICIRGFWCADVCDQCTYAAFTQRKALSKKQGMKGGGLDSFDVTVLVVVGIDEPNKPVLSLL